MKQLLSDEDFEYFSTMVLLVKTFEAAIAHQGEQSV